MTLSLEGGVEYARCIRLPYAGRDPAAFLKLVQFDLAAHPPDAPILGVAVKVHPVEPRRVQTGLFLPPVARVGEARTDPRQAGGGGGRGKCRERLNCPTRIGQERFAW